MNNQNTPRPFDHFAESDVFGGSDNMQPRRVNSIYPTPSLLQMQQPVQPMMNHVGSPANPFTSSDDKCRQITQSMNAVRLYKQAIDQIERSMAGDWYQMAQNGLYIQGFHQHTDVHQIHAELEQMDLGNAPEGIKDVVVFIKKTLKELGITE